MKLIKLYPVHSLIDKILYHNKIELKSYHKSHWQFFLELPFKIAAMSLLFFPIASLLPSIIYWAWALACLVLLVLLIRDCWKEIGYRHVYLDKSLKQLVINQHFPHQAALKSETVSFMGLLLYRHWRIESDSYSAAFLLHLQVSKCISSPGASGYLIHEELVFRSEDEYLAERSSLAAAEKIVNATGIEFIDVQNSADPRFSQWINQSLKRTNNIAK